MGTVTKICKLRNESVNTLDNSAQTLNLSEERCVGFVRYEIGIRTKKMWLVSQKAVLNKAAYIISGLDDQYIKVQKEANEIEEIKINCKEKMKTLAK